MITKRRLFSLLAALPLARISVPSASNATRRSPFAGLRAFRDVDTLRKRNVLLTVQDHAAVPGLTFRGIPIKVTDAILPSSEEAA